MASVEKQHSQAKPQHLLSVQFMIHFNRNPVKQQVTSAFSITPDRSNALAKIASRALKDILLHEYSQQSGLSYSESAAKER